MKQLIFIIFVLTFATNQVTVSKFPSGLSKALINILRNKANHMVDAAGGNTQCAKDLKILVQDFFFMERWALQMFDASAKIPTGIFQGNYFVAGSFDECLDINVIRSNHTINGKYCTVVLAPSSSFAGEFSFMFDSVAFSNFVGFKPSAQTADMLKLIKVTYGLCIPESCSIANLQKLWDHIEHTIRFPGHLNFVDILCRSKGKPVEENSADFYIYIFFGIYGMIILLSTLYDFLIHQQIESNESSMWITFSLYTNSKKLFTCGPKVEFGYLEAVNGIKVWSMLWIIFGHRVLYNVFSGTTNTLYMWHWKQSLSTTPVISASFAVDNFFVLSGLLLSFGYLKYKSTMARDGNVNFLALYVYRFLRLCPALLGVILFFISIFKHMGDGPFWPFIVKQLGGVCQYTWWTSLLFVSNYLDSYRCVDQTWYLAVDTQLFMVAPLILISLSKRPWKTCLFCIVMCIISGIYAFIVTFNNNLGAIYFEANKPYQKYIYMSTFVRMPPWLIGIIFGYLLFQYQQIHIPRAANIFAWILSTSTMLSLVLVHIVFAKYDYDPLKAATFNAAARQIWALAISSIIFLCTTGHGGLINKFLSLPIYQVFVKMSYSIYLVHLGVIMHSIGIRKHGEYFSNIKAIREFMGDLFLTLVAATICCLTFESPFIAISKILFKRSMEQKSMKQIERTRKKRNKKIVCVYDENKQFPSKKCD